MARQVNSNAKLKTLPPDALEEMWALRHPEPEGKVYSYTEILTMLPQLYDITSSMGALSEFYSWLDLKRSMDNAIARAEQAQLEFAAEHPQASPETLQGVGQMVFTSRALAAGDLKGFVMLMDVWERRQARLMQEDIWRDKKAVAQRKRETEDKIKEINSDKTLTADEQRAAVLAKMDEFFGLKKKN